MQVHTSNVIEFGSPTRPFSDSESEIIAICGSRAKEMRYTVLMIQAGQTPGRAMLYLMQHYAKTVVSVMVETPIERPQCLIP